MITTTMAPIPYDHDGPTKDDEQQVIQKVHKTFDDLAEI
jgi:hypothetical protein